MPLAILRCCPHARACGRLGERVSVCQQRTAGRGRCADGWRYGRSCCLRVRHWLLCEIDRKSGIAAMPTHELVNRWISSGLVMLNKLSPVPFLPLPLQERSGQSIPLKPLQLRWRCVSVELTGILAARKPDLLLPRTVARCSARDFINNRVRHSRLCEWMVIRKHGLELGGSRAVCNAPRANRVAQSFTRVNGSCVDVAACLSAAPANRIAHLHTSCSDWVRMIAEGWKHWSE